MDELKFEDDNAPQEKASANTKTNSTAKKATLAILLLAIVGAVVYFTFFDKNSEKLQSITNSPMLQEATNSLNSLLGDTTNTPVDTTVDTTATTQTANTQANENASNTNDIQANLQANQQVSQQANQQDTAQNLTPNAPSVNPNSLASVIPPQVSVTEDNLAVIPASEAAKFAIEKNTTLPPPLYTDKKDALTEELLGTETTPTTGQRSSQNLGDEFVQGINNDELGLGDFGKQQDSVVSIHFIDNFAKWLVTSYQPAKNGKGKTSATIQNANLRYGVNLTGLRFIENNASEGRLSILKYVYSPGMIDALYRLYGPRFLDAIAYASQERQPALSPLQVDDMYKIYANYLMDTANCLNALAAFPELSSRIDNYNARNNSLVMANTALSRLLQSLDIAVENNDRTQETQLRSQLAPISQAYDQALLSRNNYKNSIVNEIRNQNTQIKLDDESIFFLSLWVDRRLRANPNALEATKFAANICMDLANKLDR